MNIKKNKPKNKNKNKPPHTTPHTRKVTNTLLTELQLYNSGESMRSEKIKRKVEGHTLLSKVHPMEIANLCQNKSENNVFSL